MHEYLAESGKSTIYKDCAECRKRKSTICVMCNYCYSCHYKVERMEGSSKKVPPVRVTHIKNRTTPNQKLRPNKYEANFVIYRLKK
jgi:hypothetical protein